jgi:hypothetical protein
MRITDTGKDVEIPVNPVLSFILFSYIIYSVNEQVTHTPLRVSGKDWDITRLPRTFAMLTPISKS